MLYTPAAMPPSYHFPEVFGVVRIQSYREPCLQFCTATPRNRHINPSELPCYVIQNLPEDEVSLIEPRAHLSHQFLDQQIRILTCKHPITREIFDVPYWHLPIRIYNRETNQQIPILDFHFRSWLPRDYTPFPLFLNLSESELRRILAEINQERLARIRMEEDARAERSSGFDIRRFFGREDRDDRLTLPEEELVGVRGPRTPPSRRTRHRVSPPPVLQVREEPEIRVMEVRVPVERVVLQTRSPTLPTPVGQVLLDHARKGSESCPIAATPFSECASLSVTSCFHIFETESLHRWRESHTSCPVCRSEVVNVVSEHR